MRATSISQSQDCTMASLTALWMMLELEPFQQHFSWLFTVSLHSNKYSQLPSMLGIRRTTCTHLLLLLMPLQLLPWIWQPPFGGFLSMFSTLLSSTDPPTDVALQSTPASVNNGSSTTINCTGHSRPSPEFSITRRLADGTKSTSSGGTFLLQPTSREELGNNLLTCYATNSKYSTPVFSATRTILVKG